jgi:LmbE family N-acetylglucosaminyl deacetylase
MRRFLRRFLPRAPLISRAALVLSAAQVLGATQLCQAQILAPAQRLAQTIDALDVEHRWPAGVHVRWDTGMPDGVAESGWGKHTHCSAFAAAAAQRAGIYLLRPPEHQQLLLANAQYDWLATEGAAQGWRPLQDGLEAQRYANQGWFVLATYKNHRGDLPGHIAIVRPSDKDASTIALEGPQITQAGGTNYRSVALRTGFAGHPSAWARHEVRFYAHAVQPGALN